MIFRQWKSGDEGGADIFCVATGIQAARNSIVVSRRESVEEVVSI